ncbi:hypothetical protein EPN83_01345 [Patescibacteria group bacterium]|nr:MAG: hypothetical protein EPN83_01345 [Patescibacteria group bacterium]
MEGPPQFESPDITAEQLEGYRRRLEEAAEQLQEESDKLGDEAASLYAENTEYRKRGGSVSDEEFRSKKERIEEIEGFLVDLADAQNRTKELISKANDGILSNEDIVRINRLIPLPVRSSERVKRHGKKKDKPKT